MKLTTLAEDTRFALVDLADRAAGWLSPSIRLGVTGLSRAGKTVFISALAHNLIHGGRLPLFRAYAGGRIGGARIEAQPDDAVPRFEYERHVAALVDDRIWPQSTRRISELRLTIDYESATFWSRRLGRGRLHLDIVDYPGEWLLDLPLLSKDYAAWAAETVAKAQAASAARTAAPWLASFAGIDPDAPADETLARGLAQRFTEFLRLARADEHGPALPAPGRFLTPGDLEGSPALTFAPLIRTRAGSPPPGSLFRMMARRYESYKDAVVRPFFREHFARLDRQIVLVDALTALNAGPEALADLEASLTDILAAFRVGGGGPLASLVSRRIGRILVAATKADHLHHTDHDRLEAIMSRLLRRAIDRAEYSGAEVEVLAIAAVRSTREGTVLNDGRRLPAIVGVPLPGESLGSEIFDGSSEVAIFPGDLPEDSDDLFQPKEGTAASPLRFIRFRPPPLERTAEGYNLSLPHIRLDRALEFLLGDRLQ